MKNLKKALAVLLVVAISVSAGILGTIAYLTDSEEKVNVMTVGDIDVSLIEEQRNEDGSDLETFEQFKELMPAVGSAQGTKDKFGMSNDIKNYVDKIVRAGNVGKNDAFVRIIVAVPAALENDDASKNVLHWNLGNRFDIEGNGAYNTGSWNVAGNPYLEQFVSEDAPSGYVANGEIEIEGVKYNAYTFTYNGALEPGEETTATFVGFYLDSKVDYDHKEGKYYMLVNGVKEYIDYDLSKGVSIPVAVQAVQADGFDGQKAADVLNSTFYTVNAENHPWTDGLYPVVQPDANNAITLKAGESAYLSGEYTSPVTVNGEGTLYISDLSIASATGNALTVQGADVKLVANGNVTLTAGEGGSALYVEAGAKLDLSGTTGTVKAVGGSGIDTANGGSGIGGAGEIYIHDLGSLTAEGWGAHGYGIGGDNASSITIENTTIDYVKGGYAENLVESEWGKTEPEGGAAIGSKTDGAVITLDSVTIVKAEGGSKAAAIGAGFWTGVTVNITDSDIKEAVGGLTSAAIGGARVPSDATRAKDVTINIKNSKINALGGDYGAGIGGGYDTYCRSFDENTPITTINIDSTSVITAKGGKYGAGIGTGYHAAGLAGKIEAGAAINATSGGNREKYTYAMDVGFGVIDKTREATAQNTCSFDNQGTTITVSTAQDVVAE